MLLDELRVVAVAPAVPEIGIRERHLVARAARAYDRQVEPFVVEMQIDRVDEPGIGVADDALVVGVGS